MSEQSRTAIAWGWDNKYVQFLSSMESICFGEPMLGHLELIFLFWMGLRMQRLVLVILIVCLRCSNACQVVDLRVQMRLMSIHWYWYSF